MKRKTWQDVYDMATRYKFSDDELEIIKDYKSEFDEREKYLLDRGIVSVNDKDEYTISEYIKDDYKDKYESLYRKYAERFIGDKVVDNESGAKLESAPDEEVYDNKEEVKEYRIEDLFVGKED